MIGTRLRPKKSRVQILFTMYALLALTGVALAVRSLRAEQSVSGAAAFMVVFGAGMAASTLVRGGRPQVSVCADFVEVNQGRTLRTLRYRNITGVSRSDRNRLIVTLREDGAVKNEVIWLKELDPAEVERLQEFLTRRQGGR